MESLLTPPPNGDDWTVPDHEPTRAPSDEPAADEPDDELPPQNSALADEGDDEDTDDSDTEPLDPADDPDHESAPPPETDPAMTFADLKLIRPLMDAIDHAGYTHPTPIQEAVIPPALPRPGRDRPGPDRHRQDRRVPDPVPQPLAAAHAQRPDRRSS